MLWAAAALPLHETERRNMKIVVIIARVLLGLMLLCLG